MEQNKEKKKEKKEKEKHKSYIIDPMGCYGDVLWIGRDGYRVIM